MIHKVVCSKDHPHWFGNLLLVGWIICWLVDKVRASKQNFLIRPKTLQYEAAHSAIYRHTFLFCNVFRTYTTFYATIIASKQKSKLCFKIGNYWKMKLSKFTRKKTEFVIWSNKKTWGNEHNRMISIVEIERHFHCQKWWHESHESPFWAPQLALLESWTHIFCTKLHCSISRMSSELIFCRQNQESCLPSTKSGSLKHRLGLLSIKTKHCSKSRTSSWISNVNKCSYRTAMLVRIVLSFHLWAERINA